MKRYFITVALIFCMGTFCLAQQTGALFNVEKSRQELEIMKGILETSLAFSLSDEGTEQSAFRASNIDAFYLSGQGAVFMIPTSSFYRSGGVIVMPEFSEQMSALKERYVVLSEHMARQAEQLAATAKELKKSKSGIGSGEGTGVGSGSGAGIGSGQGSSPASPPLPAVSAPPAPPAPPSPPPAPIVVQVPQTSEQKEEMEARQAEYERNLEIAKDQLIETLANYGDSLTTVQPDEYVNLILSSNDYTIAVYRPAKGHQATYDVISARKSWITDYKAGRLSLEDFINKVLQYSN
jgi:hypothetical protein